MFRKIVAVLTGFALLVVLSPSPAATSPAPDQQRGCCSHHAGVSGSCCAGGAVLCNDGVCSPSCRC
jgi:hypothetical protein